MSVTMKCSACGSVDGCHAPTCPSLAHDFLSRARQAGELLSSVAANVPMCVPVDDDDAESRYHEAAGYEARIRRLVNESSEWCGRAVAAEASVESMTRVIDYARERRVDVEKSRAEALVRAKGAVEERDDWKKACEEAQARADEWQEAAAKFMEERDALTKRVTELEGALFRIAHAQESTTRGKPG